ncbi:DMT family transporter [Variovorax sp.]|uniref:DMT family transporter n=1 Tax=Variovorax sp. TaxID=1871043 RepID=UPI003BAC1D5C
MHASTPSSAAQPPVNPAFEWALLAVLATCWGASYTFIKIGVATIPPVTLIAARTLVAGALLLAVLRMRGVRLPKAPAMWGRFAVQACLNSVLPFTLIAWAERSVDAGLATILNSTSPIFIFLLGLGLGSAGKPTLQRFFGVGSGLAGICLIVGLEALNGLGHSLLAQLALVVAAVCYGCAAMFGRVFTGLDPMVPAAGSLLSGAAMLLPASLAIDRPWTLAPSGASMAAVLALAVLSTALAFTIYFRLIRTLGPMSTSAQAYLRVPIGVAIGVLFLGETLSPTAWIGLGCVVAGVIAMTMPEAKLLRRGLHFLRGF